MRRIILFFCLFYFIFPTSKAGDPVRVACVGNSVTYGAGIENRGQNSYPAQLQQLLGNNYQVENFGRSGTTLLSKGHRPYIEQEEYQKALDFTPDIAVIHLGLNDTDPRNWPNYKDDFIPDYMELINSFKLRNPKTKIYICRLTPIFDWHPRFQSGTYTWYHQIQQAIEKTADIASLPLIDLNEDLRSRPDLFPDCIHPTKGGAEIIARRVYASLTGDFGGLKLSSLFADGMVLQRDQPLRITGTADAGQKVKIQFGKTRQETTSDFQGHWEIVLPASPADRNGQKLSISSGDREFVFEDVLVGDVWLCSGQSNMEFPFKSASDFDLQKIKLNPNVRLFHMKPISSESGRKWDTSFMEKVNRLEYFQTAGWINANDLERSKNFSAIAIVFGSMLADSLSIPIGLIQNAVGGSPQESWISRTTFEKSPTIIGFLNKFSENDRIQEWVRTRAGQNTAAAENSSQRHPYQPAYLYEAGIEPLDKFPIKGVLWYQGESNAQNAELYELLFTAFIDCWRENWQDENLPVIYAQLSSISRPGWEYFRNTQRLLAEKISNVAMVITSDVGDSLDVHPKQKTLVGQRMAKTALAMCYNKNIEYSGPMYKGFEIKGNKIILDFEYNRGLQSSSGGEVIGFEIAGKNTVYYPAEAVVKNDKIELSTAEVKKPCSARYAWKPFTRANLINAAGFPASTFETKPSYEK